MPAQVIKIIGARQHNLKNLSVEIPREKLVVITGLSGSGKSSLAFDTLYAEGQRRYVESLSAYARQFLDRMEKPNVDFIQGLSPAIAIEQRSAGANPRSTIATTTEIYDYLRVLFSAVGQPHDPVTGQPLSRETPQQIVEKIIASTSQHSNTSTAEREELVYSTDYGNAATGFRIGELTPRHFSFNSHLGACPACHGLGTQLVCDPELMISDPGKTLAEGAITPWRRGTKRMQAYYRHLQKALVNHFHINEDVPFSELPDQFKQALYFGTNGAPIEMGFSENGPAGAGKVAKPFEGLIPQMQRLYEQTQSEFTRNRIRSFMTYEPCKVCNGARLKPEILAVTIKDRHALELNIHQLSELTTEAAARFIATLELTAQQRAIVRDVVREIQSRLQFLVEVGLGYLTLNRQSGTLSGGEAQRIRLATQIGSGLAGVLYILDEPSIGLHQRDNARLLGTLRRLRDLGNSDIVVEHDEETIRAADHIIDLGPGAGPRGGEIVAQGKLKDILCAKNSLTGDYLSGRARIAIPKQRVQPRSDGWLTVVGATENNLKKIDVSFPLGCLACVTGVSGSGKSTLVDDILRRSLFRRFYNAKEKQGSHRALQGVEQ